MSKSVVMFGPRRCGKTRNSRRIASRLGLDTILDSWWPDPDGPGRIPARGVLVIVQDEDEVKLVRRQCPGIRVMPYSEAAALAGLR